ncbi:UDP-glucose 4-epimerase family protein [Janthinobacterium sp. 1_2014MBL_MicDiv]|uniref:UDP-glucose 4-epimerase family protein n=1 Tax=Janthinobacterium sp. 1_2014MBL_MicDiv TaxID=1644131 RepID=UPI0008F48C47|nr:SDR family oxidoreductase [Janthinobacterium sp. 1_2014MBL_MicDiv]APA67014.1 UDP-glucose 4-epimerase [Janthinobacterium sp. 1_2014MBL_MicDiv]
MQKILITGANGFVGAALCAELARRQLPFSAAARTKLTPSTFPIGDLSATTKWAEALESCSVVIHLAARVHVMQESATDALAAYREINVAATMNLARQAAQQGVKRFVFVSSVKVNGESTGAKPFTASDTAAPQDPYGQSKHEAECALREFSRQSGMEVVIVRPPLVYGPGVRANFHRLMRLAKTGLPLPLGAVHNRRSMVALDNLVDLLILCSSHPRAAGETFLVSDDCDVSIGQLLKMLSTAMGKRSWLLPVPVSCLTFAATLLGQSMQARRLLESLQVDISHTKQTLGWLPAVSLPEAVHKTASAFLSLH